MLPACSDETLIDELDVIVTYGADLPTSPKAEEHISHWLLFADQGEGAAYGRRARRLRTLVDLALQDAPLDESDPLLSKDHALGLRILLGLHPDYRDQTVDERRKSAAMWLIPGWKEHPPEDPARAFQRRRQTRVLGSLVECLRATYGQADGPPNRDTETLSVDRYYRYNAQRWLVYQREVKLLRVRVDELEGDAFYEERLGEEVLDFELRPLPYPETGDQQTLHSIQPVPFMRRHRQVALQFDEAKSVGDVVGVAWEERRAVVAELCDEPTDYVSQQAPNDNYDLCITVEFEREPPEVVWAFSCNPYILVDDLGPDGGLLLPVTNNVVTHSWSQTQRRVDYGIKWQWRTR